MGANLAGLDPINYFLRKIYLHTDPLAPLLLANGKRSTAPTKGVKNQVSGHRRHFYDPVQDFGGECICTAILRFELPVAHRRYVGPNIFQVHTLRIHSIPVTTIVFDFASAMSTGLNRRADSAERLWFSLRVVQQTVVAWMQPSWNRKTSRNLYRNPMPEVHSESRKMGAKLYVPLRKIVQKERPSRLDCTYAFRDPLFTPL